MDRALRLYADRWRFRHPRLPDFVAAVTETTGRDWSWYFDRTFFSSGSVDYAVDQAESVPSKPPKGLFEKDGKLSEGPPPELATARGWDSVVTVVRRGETALPVEVLLRFAGGYGIPAPLDRQGRGARFSASRAPPLIPASAGPRAKISLPAHSLY